MSDGIMFNCFSTAASPYLTERHFDIIYFINGRSSFKDKTGVKPPSVSKGLTGVIKRDKLYLILHGRKRILSAQKFTRKLCAWKVTCDETKFKNLSERKVKILKNMAMVLIPYDDDDDDGSSDTTNDDEQQIEYIDSFIFKNYFPEKLETTEQQKFKI